MTKVEEFHEEWLETIDMNIRSFERELERWKDRFEKNPFEAFRWSDEVQQIAANSKVWQEIEALRESDLETITNMLQEEVLRRARSIPQSTSRASNAMELWLLEAYTKALEEVKGWLRMEQGTTKYVHQSF